MAFPPNTMNVGAPVGLAPGQTEAPPADFGTEPYDPYQDEAKIL
jgi:hypothetical protein